MTINPPVLLCEWLCGRVVYSLETKDTARSRVSSCVSRLEYYEGCSLVLEQDDGQTRSKVSTGDQWEALNLYFGR